MMRLKDWAGCVEGCVVGCVVCLIIGFASGFIMIFVVCLIVGCFVFWISDEIFMIASCYVERAFYSYYADSYWDVAGVVQEFIFRVWTKSVQRSTNLQH
jgi:hypothetical protein